MGWVLGARGRRMQYALEELVGKIQGEERLEESGNVKTIVAPIPEVQALIESRGFCRRDGNSRNVNDNELSSSQEQTSKDDIDRKDAYNQLGFRFYHPLEKHLGSDVINLKKITSLGIKDFLCDDGFHPGRYGTVLIGRLLSDAYRKLTCPQ
jgi:hypothetical protein